MPAPTSDCHDCVPCHFEYEEETALPYLPPQIQQWLLRDHARIRNAGYPADQILEHAQREMVFFRHYCPPHIVAQVQADHEFHEPDLLRQAAQQQYSRRRFA